MELPRGGKNREKEEIVAMLEEYPHSFTMKDMHKVHSKAFESLVAHLEAALDAGYSSTLETARTTNLLAYALSELGELSKALERTEDVLRLEDQQHNVVALANKVYILCMTHELDDAREVVEDLKDLRKSAPDFPYLLVKAKAELAASYLRFGPRFNHYAAEAFEEVIHQAQEPEVWMWKFGLAVTHRHALDLQYAPYAPQREDNVTHQDALKLLREIIDSRGPGASDNLKANAHAEMALLLRCTLDEKEKNMLAFKANSGPMASCKKALQLDDNDSSVLWKSGKLFRNYRDLFKSRKLLEKAVTLQKSSAAYHHLGLTYKAMATSLQHGKLKTRRGGKRNRERKTNREEKMKKEKALGAEPRPEAESQAPGAVGKARADKERSLADREKEKREQEKVERIKRVVKSPKGTTQFDPDENNVQLAVSYLQKAIDFSKGENSRAVYDLALMYIGMNNYPEALKLLKDITQRQNPDIRTPSGVLEQITALEQTGLIYQRMAKVEENVREKAKLKKKGERVFNEALSLTSDLYSSTAHVRDIFGKIFHSPSALLKAADASGRGQGETLKRKAEIFKLINNNKQSQALLAEIAEGERDETYHKMKIESYRSNGEPEKAAAYIAMLKPTEQYPKVMKLFESQRDVHMVRDVYLAAGKKALLESSKGQAHGSQYQAQGHPDTHSGSSYSDSDQTHAHYFRKAFAEAFDIVAGAEGIDSAAVQNPRNVTTNGNSIGGACAADNGSGSRDFDVMLLHDVEDDSVEQRAQAISTLLQKVCGLRIVIRNNNYPPGSPELNAILKNMDQSRLVVVLPGQEEVTPLFSTYVSHAAERGSTVVLLTEGVTEENIPREIRPPSYRRFQCSSELFANGPDSDVNVKAAVCQLFDFFISAD